MQRAAVYLLGEALVQNNRKAFQKGWCKTGFAFQREVDPASLSRLLNWQGRQVPWHKGGAIETLSRNRAAGSLHPERGRKQRSKIYKPTDVF